MRVWLVLFTVMRALLQTQTLLPEVATIADVDHRVGNWLVVKAMQDLVREGSLSRNTELVVDQVYGQQPEKHAPYQGRKLTFFVSGEAAKLGQEATWYYQSQEGNGWNATLKPATGQ